MRSISITNADNASQITDLYGAYDADGTLIGEAGMYPVAVARGVQVTFSLFLNNAQIEECAKSPQKFFKQLSAAYYRLGDAVGSPHGDSSRGSSAWERG